MSYRGITLSSIIAKTFEVVILKCMSPILDERGFPDINQTAFQRGISCNDAIFSTQEVLLNYIRQGENPFLCFYDIEKAFDSVEFPILLTHLFTAGINGKSWRLIKSWYDSPTSRVKHGNNLSSSFLVNCKAGLGIISIIISNCDELLVAANARPQLWRINSQNIYWNCSPC